MSSARVPWHFTCGGLLATTHFSSALAFSTYSIKIQSHQTNGTQSWNKFLPSSTALHNSTTDASHKSLPKGSKTSVAEQGSQTKLSCCARKLGLSRCMYPHRAAISWLGSKFVFTHFNDNTPSSIVCFQGQGGKKWKKKILAMVSKWAKHLIS